MNATKNEWRVEFKNDCWIATNGNMEIVYSEEADARKLCADANKCEHKVLTDERCGVAHFDVDGNSLPDCQRCHVCGEWVSYLSTLKKWIKTNRKLLDETD